ncbi:hypothetical protein P3T37_005756 [Kitasatospora sp. MAA4]|uniref:hypothetical protein n=1 Tax=Kitasatospora sp. MAA4 TaxID=3035093 RepID=UPI0024753ED7|nr:hypothetical protein [Kitasatospora sp. MAA4]MDH6136331.1 hypothetical protein [Kitasatospora sp. MAA4]
MPEPDLGTFEAMWTTERDQYVLWRLSSGGFMPMQKGDPPMAVLICDDELSSLVRAKMLEAGVEVVDPSGGTAAESR